MTVNLKLNLTVAGPSPSGPVLRRLRSVFELSQGKSWFKYASGTLINIISKLPIA
jgi:hypothetical protein